LRINVSIASWFFLAKAIMTTECLNISAQSSLNTRFYLIMVI